MNTLKFNLLLEVAIHKNIVLDKQKWDDFVTQSEERSVYALSSFLDAVFPQWEALILEEGNEWQAVLPLFPIQKLGIKANLQPPFCQYAGVLFKPIAEVNPYKYYQAKNELVQALVDHYPFYHLIDVHFSPNFDYPLPFYWKGFQLFTRYTYRIDFQETPLSFNKLRTNHQRTIKKGLKQNYRPEETTETEEFVAFFKRELVESQNALKAKHLPILNQLIQNMHSSGHGLLKCIRNEEGEIIAGAFFIQFENIMYYIIGASNKEGKEMGAFALLLWNQLEEAYDKCEIFDFEGSMIQSIEHFFRGFGAKPVPFLRIYKNQLPLRPLWAMFGY